MQQNNRRRNNIPRIFIPPRQITVSSEAYLSLEFALSLSGSNIFRQFLEQRSALYLQFANDRVSLRNSVRNLQIEFANRLPNPQIALEISQRHFNAVIARDENNNN